jgi:hypothetical protein
MPTNETLLNEATAYYELLLALSNDCVLADEGTESLECVVDSSIVVRIG